MIYQNDFEITVSDGLDYKTIYLASEKNLNQLVAQILEELGGSLGDEEPEYDEIWDLEQDFIEQAFDVEVDNAEGTEYYNELLEMGPYHWGEGFVWSPQDFGLYEDWADWRQAHTV